MRGQQADIPSELEFDIASLATITNNYVLTLK